MREQTSGSMPSFTLPPGGKDRSVIRRHFPELWPFGITPTQLMCRYGMVHESGHGPSMRPSDISFCRYSVTISGCCPAECMLAEAEDRGDSLSNLIRKPPVRPSMRYLTNALSGWVLRALTHSSTSSGVWTGARSEGTVIPSWR